MPDFVTMLTRPSSGTALFVEADRKIIRVRRRIKHHCTLEEWNDPIRRLAKIAEAWALTEANIRAEGETLVCPSPVTLYREPFSGDVVCADIQQPGDSGPKWIDAQGNRLLLPPLLLGLIREQTTYAAYAEGPLDYLGDHAAIASPDPLGDRSLQRVRHQNRHLREKIDAAIGGDDRGLAVDVGHEEYVDFRVRGVFERPDLRTIGSKQTGEATRLILESGTVEIRDLDPADITE